MNTKFVEEFFGKREFSRDEILKFLTENNEKLKCVGCGRSLIDTIWYLDHYPHDGGIYLKEYGRRMWVYIHCEKCGYETALWKLVRQYEVLETRKRM